MLQLGGYRRGAIPVLEPEADLRLIYGYLMENWFIRPFDWNISVISQISQTGPRLALRLALRLVLDWPSDWS